MHTQIHIYYQSSVAIVDILQSHYKKKFFPKYFIVLKYTLIP